MAVDVLSAEWMLRVLRAKLGDASGVFGNVLHARLFVSDVTPDCFVSSGALTECTLPGYAAITLPYAGWSIAPYPTSGSCGWRGSFSPVTFAFDSGGQTIYGLWVDFFAAPNIAWVKRLDVPYVVPSEGGSLQVQPNVIEKPCT